MPPQTSPDLGQFELRLSEDFFYDESPNCRATSREYRRQLPGAVPRPAVHYPADPPAGVFLAHLQTDQPLSLERALAFRGTDLRPNFERDFSAPQVGEYRLRRNLHRWLSLLATKPAHESTADAIAGVDLAHDSWGFDDDRLLDRSLLLRTNFATSNVGVRGGRPLGETTFAQLYRGVFDRDYSRWARSHRRYRGGPRRPGLLLVARARGVAAVVAEGACEVAARPAHDSMLEVLREYDKELWDSLEGQEKLDACEVLLQEDVDERDFAEMRRRWLDEGEVPENAFYHLRPAEAEQLYRDRTEAGLRQVMRKVFASVLANMLNLFEMCGAVYGSVILDGQYARLYVLSSGRIAMEVSDGSLVNDARPVQSRPGVPYSIFMEQDLRALAPLRFVGEQRTHFDPPGDRFCRRLGDQAVDRAADATTPRERFENTYFPADLAGIQTYTDFLAAGVVRLGAERTDAPARLPTPIQDAWERDVDECLMRKGLPAELALRIRAYAKVSPGLARYLVVSPDEEERRPDRTGTWHRIARRWRRRERGWGSDRSSTDHSSAVSSAGSDFGLGDHPAHDHIAEAEGSDDEDENSELDEDDGASNAASEYSEATRQWIAETGSVASATDAPLSDWRAFDVDDFERDPDAQSEAGGIAYSAYSAEADEYEAHLQLDKDKAFVLAIAERVLDDIVRIVPVTPAEMDALVQAQYKLDLARYT